ncbi:MAG: YfcE family phosphodiesterase [Clostridia bacterium]|nr:YfcE family phosphodiesterase [Clostridia bacterium]
MKKIIVTSDTHGHIEALYSIYKLHSDADIFIHLGDYVQDAQKVSQRLGMEVLCVKANGDAGSTMPEKRMISIEGVNILAVHGHHQAVKLSLMRLSLLAQEMQADVALFGHTHYSLLENNGILFINPGYGGSGRYAIITVDKGRVEAELKKQL